MFWLRGYMSTLQLEVRSFPLAEGNWLLKEQTLSFFNTVLVLVEH